jgi:hypothetical protein
MEVPEYLLILSKYLPGMGPIIAAFLLTHLVEGKDGMLQLLKRG